ncbi:hypothetical protein SpCBS45565_g03992 [Spizellomyces sp. 'palustris']|nr:hypothetical protein SpCBS45565_g03992 [Spizellomyces sp. 'palustris']
MTDPSDNPTPPASSPSGPSPEALAQRRALVNAKFGPGAWERSQPRPHRCNDHLEDFIVALTTWPMQDVPSTFNIFWQCMRSEPGNEPPRDYKTPVPYGSQAGQKRGMWFGDDEPNDLSWMEKK